LRASRSVKWKDYVLATCKQALEKFTCACGWIMRFIY